MSSPARSLALSTGAPSQAKQPQVYQIDFTAVASGKRIASSKRRVRWRFGFANPEALAAGLTGTDCRGEEHDVTIVWSITSGKRLVLADGQEVHYSNSRNSVFDFSWTMRGSHVLKVIAHASPPVSATPGFRQYDFFVDGQSFFTFPKVFRLGLAPNDPRSSGSPRSPFHMADRSAPRGSYVNGGGPGAAYGREYGGGEDRASIRSAGSANIAAIEAPHNPDEEEAYLQEAIKNSLKETHSPAPPRPAITSGAATESSRSGDSLLLDFMTPAPPPNPNLPDPGPVAALPMSSSYASDMFAPPPQQQHQYPALPPSSSVPPPAETNGYGNADPWLGMSAPLGVAPPASANPFGSPVPFAAAAPTGPSQYGSVPPPIQTHPYGPTAAAAPASEDPFGAGERAGYGGSYGQAYPPVANGYGQEPSPPEPALTPMASAQPRQHNFTTPVPTVIAAPQHEFTPATQASSIGFASPMAQPYTSYKPHQEEPGSEHAQIGFEETMSAPSPAPAPPVDPAIFSMNVLSGQEQDLVTDSMIQTNGTSKSGTTPHSLADQAYAKLVNLDSFSLVSDKGAESRKNPFDSSSLSIGGNGASLSDMKSNKKTGEKKEIMKSYAMVVSTNQQGNFGGFGGYSMGGGIGMQQPAPPPVQRMGALQQQQQQQQQPPPPMMQGYGGMQQSYGQLPPAQTYGQSYGQSYSQQGYGMQQPSYGQTPPMQQSYGQPPIQQQQQQQQFGQPPPMQQQPFGF